MKILATALVTLSLLTAGVATISVAAETPSSTSSVRFGMDTNSVYQQTEAGVKPDYGTFWVGPWTLKHGWGGPDNMMQNLRGQDITPAIHFYYWGDDISKDCIENGCWSSLHGAQKDKAGWQRLADELVVHLNSQMQGEPVVIFLETEFNKADVQNYEPLDGYLAEKAQQIHAGYPNAHVVLSLGSWNTGAWSTWDRAAQASDAIGLQGLRGTTRDSAQHYDNLYKDTLNYARTAQTLFGQPIFLQDIGLSSYPEPQYLSEQAEGLQRFFTGMPDLKAAGVEAIIYRSWRDTNMDLANYYGEAERHWGLAWGGGTYKPAAQVWIDGVKAERSGTTSGPAPTGPAPALTADFTPSPNNNAWWVEVRVKASNPVSQVAASHDGGAWNTLPATSWGSYAKSYYAPAGGTMTFRVTDTYGQTVTSDAYPWLTSAEPEPAPEPVNQAPTAAFTAQATALQVQLDASGSQDPDGDALSYTWTLGDGNSATGATASHTYTQGGTYTVTLEVGDGTATDSASQDVTVERPNRAPTAALTALVQGDQVYVDGSGSSDPDGDPLAYHWDFGDGATAQGATASHRYATVGDPVVTLTVDDGQATATAQETVTIAPPPFEATFRQSGNVNPWWVEVRVDADGALAKVEARHNDGAWQTLELRHWGAWAKSFNAPAGGTMTYRATDSHGQTAQAQQPWLAAQATPAFTATFTPTSSVNPWWVEVKVDASSPPTKVEARHDNGQWVTLSKTSWGTWATSFHAPPGTMTFRATDGHGQVAQSDPIPWLQSNWDVSFKPKAQQNAWWVEVRVQSDKSLSHVEVRKDGGSWMPLDQTHWGTWAKSFYAKGTIEFRAVASDGEKRVSDPYRWG